MKFFQKQEAFKPTATIAEVHEAFDSATDNIILAAKNILAKANKDELQELQDLNKLGFSSVSKVKEAHKIITQKEDSEKLAILSKKCFDKYGKKFITLDLLRGICTKYGLVFGDPKDYIGEIPTENRKEILGFKLSGEDSYKYIFSYANYSGWVSIEIPKEEYEHRKKSREEPHTHCKREQRGFKIVGTKDLFDLKNKVIVDSEVKLINPDPIVLHEVEGGYLIITKWGAEEDISELN